MAINKVIDRNGSVLIDLTNDTVTPSKVLSGTKFHGGDGKEYVGTLSAESTNLKYKFIDYDGTVMYTFTDAEIDAMTELPAGPDHTDDNLTFQQWNWTLDELKNWDRTRTARPIVGASMVTTDGKTYITVDTPANQRFYIYYAIPDYNEGSTGSFTIDWGDGTTEDIRLESTYNNNISHVYSNVGVYDIVITVNSGKMILGYTGGNSSGSSPVYMTSIKLGNIVGIGALTYCNQNMFCKAEKINIPATAIEYVQNKTTFILPSLNVKGIVLPRGIKTHSNADIFKWSNIDIVSLPSKISIGYFDAYHIKEVTLDLDQVSSTGGTSAATIAYYSGDTLEVFANNIEKLVIQNILGTRHLRISGLNGTLFLYNANQLESVEFINSNVTGILGAEASYVLKTLVVPDSVTTLGTNSSSFSRCYLLTLDLSQQTKVLPLTASIGLGTGSNYKNKILVPKELLDQYKSASYWSNYASIMVGV